MRPVGAIDGSGVRGGGLRKGNPSTDDDDDDVYSSRKISNNVFSFEFAKLAVRDLLQFTGFRVCHLLLLSIADNLIG